MYSSYDDPDYRPKPGDRERHDLYWARYELAKHEAEVARLKAKIKELESSPYVLDTPLPF